MDDSIRAFVTRLQRDVGSVEPTAVIGVFDLATRRWIVESADTTPPEDFGDEGWVARIHRNELLVEELDELPIDVANFAQDLVMDETGRSWPDVERDGRSVHLEPEEWGGDVWWAYRGDRVWAVGALPAL